MYKSKRMWPVSCLCIVIHIVPLAWNALAPALIIPICQANSSSSLNRRVRLICPYSGSPLPLTYCSCLGLTIFLSVLFGEWLPLLKPLTIIFYGIFKCFPFFTRKALIKSMQVLYSLFQGASQSASEKSGILCSLEWVPQFCVSVVVLHIVPLACNALRLERDGVN